MHPTDRRYAKVISFYIVCLKLYFFKGEISWQNFSGCFTQRFGGRRVSGNYVVKYPKEIII